MRCANYVRTHEGLRHWLFRLLRSLCIGGCDNITDVSITALARAACATKLRMLDVKGCDMTDAGGAIPGRAVCRACT